MRRLLMCLGIVSLAATPALAQDPPAAGSGRPYRGLFGGPTASGGTGEHLTLSLVLSGGYDNNVLALDDDGDGTFDPVRGRDSTVGRLRTQLTYSRRADRFRIAASGGASGQYFRALNDRFSSQVAGTVTVSGSLSSRTQLTAAQRVNYQPYHALGLGAGPLPPGVDPALVLDFADPDTQTRVRSRLSFNSTVGLSHRLARRTSLTLQYGYGRSGSASVGLGHRTHSGRAGLVFGIGRGVNLRVGYRYAEHELGPADMRTRFADHAADVALDFDQAIVLARGTTLSFGGGLVGVRDDDRTRYRLAGQVGLSRELGRTWHTSVQYSRNVRYTDTFQQPVYSDMLAAGVGGLVNRRLQLDGSIGASLGEVGRQGANQFRSYFARTGMTVGLTRRVGVSLDYVFSRYRYGVSVALPAGVPGEARRHGVAVSLRLAPLWSWTR